MMMLTSDPTLQLAFGMPGGWEWIVILLIGLLIFGRRLPEVGRSIGKSIVEFKRGVKGINEEIEAESAKAASSEPARLPADQAASVQSSTEARAEMPARQDESTN